MKPKLAWPIIGAALFCAGYVVAQQKPAPEVRRVVTKIDETGKAVVMFDERVQMSGVRPPNYVAPIWLSDKSLPDFSMREDAAKRMAGLMPPKGVTVCRVVVFVPEPDAVPSMAMNTMQKVVGAAGTAAKDLPPRQPMMHRT